MKYLFFDIECANCFGGTGKICEFSYILSDEHFNEIELNQFIINPNAPFDSYVLKNHGCTYKLKASECDYFVTKAIFDENGVEYGCSRLMYVQEAIANGKNINIITFDELLVLLNTTEEELEKMPMPDESSFLKKKKEKKENLAYVYSTDRTKGTTIGDILATQGIILNSDEE